MIRCIILTALAVFASLSVSSGARADEYVGGSSQFEVFLGWTSDSSGHLQGQIQMASLSGPEVIHTSASFTGTRNGSGLSIVFPLLSHFSGQTWTGSVSFRSLNLDLPNNAELQLSTGTFNDFRAQVSALEQAASSTASAEAAVEARTQHVASVQRRLSLINDEWLSAKNRLASALSELRLAFPIPAPDPTNPRTIRARYALAETRIEEAWVHEQTLGTTASLTCYQKAQVTYAAAQVSYARSQLQYQDTEFAAFERKATDEIASAYNAMSALEQIYPTYAARYQDYRRLIPTAPHIIFKKATIEEQRRVLTPLLEQYHHRLATVRALVQDTDRNGDALNAKAEALPSSLTCSG